MWRNTEVAVFIDWLRAHNAALHPGEHAGFFGLDIYNMSASIAAVLEYLDRFDPEGRRRARALRLPDAMAARPGDLRPRGAHDGLCQMRGDRCCWLCAILLAQAARLRSCRIGDSFLDAAQNARLIASAERYYRVMYYGGGILEPARPAHVRDA